MQADFTMLENKDELIENLRTYLDEVCDRLAAKYSLFDCFGRPRKALIADALFRFGCLGCIWKTFTQLRMFRSEVDCIYMEMHSLALNILSGALMQMLNGRNLNVSCEEKDNFGRSDVVIRRTGFQAVVEADGVNIIVEVKTGKSISFAQLFRYLLQHPNAILVVWRVAMRQVFTLSGEKLKNLLCLYTASAINRGLSILNGDVAACQHSVGVELYRRIENPQLILENFFQGLTESLPLVVAVVAKTIEEVKK